MQARGLLMIEHRLIERMIAVLRQSLAKIESTGQVDPVFVDNAVDFIRISADRTHHGKEEDILFRNLRGRALSAEDEKGMNQLIEEHVFGRQTTEALVKANERYRNGDMGALADIENNIKTLTEFYPQHIEKEDKVFFPASRAYFTEEEDRAMLSEFWEFDKNLIHEKYESIVSAFEKVVGD